MKPETSLFRKVLIANRGEIAVRIIRTLREMGISSVAAFSDADRDALFVLEADESHRLGPAPALESYLNTEAILAVAQKAKVDAIHPGYGFLSENSSFARAVAEGGFIFIGPTPEAIALMGDKVAARRAVQKLDVPVVPGTDDPIENLEDALDFANQAGYPVAVKAAGGGGGRGIHVVRKAEEMQTALEAAERQAGAYFKNAEIYLEKYFDNPRHVEIQVLGDSSGNLIHLGERDCSVQRRYQKLIEETPSPAVHRRLREQMGGRAVRAAEAASYTGAGTVEFLLTTDEQFFFLEMNTRVQVEHPITEAVTGVDLIREMVLIAAGEPMTLRDSVLDLNGHAIEVRVNAENPLAGFRPAPAAITRCREPGGIGIRVDSGVYEGYAIPPNYDSLIAKLIAWAPDREQARRRILRALREYSIEGPDTTIPFSMAVLESEQFAVGEIGTSFVEQHLEQLQQGMAATPKSGGGGSPIRSPSTPGPRRFDVEASGKHFRVEISELASEKRESQIARSAARRPNGRQSNSLSSPMHGTVIKITKSAGQQVRAGEPLFVIEAMKMENDIPAPRDGILATLEVKPGETVEIDQLLATIE